jgi:D-alanyl-D-alanine carboxypeptidase/D-alanyl-D-alanine-endopeptidase (penicillin-binding protein 4)
MHRVLAIALATATLVAPAAAAPPTRAAHAAPTKLRKPSPLGAYAHVSIGAGGEFAPAGKALTPEATTAQAIEKLLHGPLRNGRTGLLVADAVTGEPLFAVDADEPLNPASNVKMISMATALELLGPEFTYPTRVLGATPRAGVVRGDVYLLGSYDPTLSAADLDQLAASVAARGITQIDGAVVLGGDATRDGLYRATLPIAVTAGAPGSPPLAVAPPGFDFVTVASKARTAGRVALPRLAAIAVSSGTPAAPKLLVTITGYIGKGGTTTVSVGVKDRAVLTAYTLAAALRAHGVTVASGFRIEELGDFVGDAIAKGGGVPVELGRHDSKPLGAIITSVDKWSINWLADRVIVTAAALARRQPPSMPLAVDAMYDWLGRHAHLAKTDVLVDSGSGLSYHTRISARELVGVVRAASGYGDPSLANTPAAHAWLDSLSIAGIDGTLAHRFRTSEVRGHMHGKTGTLSTVIALSGIVDLDPKRPLAFALVTNSATPLSKGYVRRAHELLIGVICQYLATTRQIDATVSTPVVEPAAKGGVVPEDLEDENLEGVSLP